MMSSRLVPYEAHKALRSRSSRAVIARGLTTTSTDYANRATPSQGPKKRLVREAKRKDDKLRHAINLFQMANFFFPTKAAEDESSTLTSSSSSSSLLDPSTRKGSAARKDPADADQKDGLDETLDDHIRGTIMGNSQHQIFDSNVLMQTANAFLQAKGAQDRSQFASVYQQDSPNAEVAEHDWSQLFPQSGPRNRPRLILSSITNEEVSTGSLTPLPAVEDREAVERYVAETVKRAATARALEERKTVATNLDVRGAQVMDALYGTVGGQFPGLDVLKERVKEEKERKQQQQEEEKRQSEIS